MARATKPKKNQETKKAKAPVKNNTEIISILTMALGLVLGVFCYVPETGVLGELIKNLSLGLFGPAIFSLPVIVFAVGLHFLVKKDVSYKSKYIISLFVPLVISVIIHLISYGRLSDVSVSEFYSWGKNCVGGGFIGGIICEPIVTVIGILASYIVFISALIIMAIIIFDISFLEIFRKTGGFIKNLFASQGKKSDKKPEKSGKQPEKAPEKPTNDDFRKIKEMFGEDEPAEPTIKIYGLDTKEKDESKDADKHSKEEKKAKEPENNVAEEVVIDGSNEIIEYSFPSVDLLDSGKGPKNETSENDLKENAKKLVDTLKSFGVEARVLNIERGPSVTRYELQPNVGVKVSKITGLADDIALNLAARGVRIEAPIPGKAAVGIEVPNKSISTVHVRDVIDSEEFRKCSSKLAFALGKDISGKTVLGDIAKMPHLLIAGATGSGKSVCINTLISSILYKSNPNEVKLLMIDPKVVELSVYNGIPHLLIPVVTEPKKAAGALNWAVSEMVSRYKLFADNNVRDLRGYNQIQHENDHPERVLPQIVIIVDELADLMMVAPRDVEDAICRLAQLARAAGMHLVIATQRPSVDVITGIIKANIPSRISFAVSSQVDSRTILDMAGAEKLLGKGDMLYYPTGEAKPIRIQGAFVSDKEVERIVAYVKGSGSDNYDEDIMEKIESGGETNASSDEEKGDADAHLSDAIALVVEKGEASVSMIQRKFKVGYARAARIVDQMEERGIVSEPEGSKPRRVLISRAEYLEMIAGSDEI